MKEIICKICSEPMKNIGNIDGTVYLSYPEQWDDTYICEKDKTKEVIRKRGQLPPDYSFVKDYKPNNELTDI